MQSDSEPGASDLLLFVQSSSRPVAALGVAVTRKQQRSGRPYRLPLAWLSASRREHVSSDAWRGANPLLQVAGRTERVVGRREGLAAAVLIDATIIRGIMLPASMKLLGDWNWYLPSWLEWLPHIGGEGEPPAPPRAPRAPEATKEPEPRPV